MDRSDLSPLAITSRYIAKTFSFRQQMINAGPKIFAARIGALFSVVIIALAFTGGITAAFFAGVVRPMTVLPGSLGVQLWDWPL